MTAFQDWWHKTYASEYGSSFEATKALAAKSGISCTTISTLIRGALLRNAEKAKALSAATDGKVTPGELLGL